jgi:hypothetical protein
MPAPYTLENDVVREIEKYFGIHDQKKVIAALGSTQLWADHAGPPARIHLAMIWKSKGDIKIFERTVRYDASDWRDLLIETGLANTGWEDRLKQKGIFPEKWAPVDNRP